MRALVLWLLVAGCSDASKMGADGSVQDMAIPARDGSVVSYTCTRSIDVNPGQSIAAATANAVAGDCINVHAGTYMENSTIGFSNDGTMSAPIVVRSVDGKGAALIDAGGNRTGETVLIRQDYIIIDGFEFQNSPTDTQQQVVHFDGLFGTKTNGSVLRNCKITGGYDHIKVNENSLGVTVEYNEFYGTFGHIPISLTGASNFTFRGNVGHDWNTAGNGAIQLKGGSHDAVFDGNLFHDITSDAGTIAFGDGCDSTCDIDAQHYAAVRAVARNNIFVRVGRAFDLQGCNDCAVLSNTVVDSGAGNVLIKLTSATTNGTTTSTLNARIFDNLMTNLGDVIQINSPAGMGLTMDYNLVYMGSWGGDHPSTADAHSVMGDPKLGADYSLGPGSAAIGVGTNLVADVPDDYNGIARPASAPFDIGAIQSQ
jgi:hypothetical protein